MNVEWLSGQHLKRKNLKDINHVLSIFSGKLSSRHLHLLNASGVKRAGTMCVYGAGLLVCHIKVQHSVRQVKDTCVLF